MVDKSKLPINRVDGLSEELENKLNQNQITNCLLTNPKLVDLELSNGTLTLKAGSTVIVPYGKSAPTMKIDDTLNGGIISDISWDGSKLFYYVQYDVNKTFIVYNGNQKICCLQSSGSTDNFNPNGVYSGSEEPSVSYYALWYDTTNNIVKKSNSTGEWTNFYFSLPFCLATVDSTSWTSIDQVFQSIGYIGSTVWVSKGVKGLAPNGRNEDGSLNNTTLFTNNIITFERNLTQTDVKLWLNNSHNLLLSKGIDYDEKRNTIYVITDTSNTTIACELGSLDLSAGVISNFVPNPTFHAVDYNDFQQLKTDFETSDEQNVKLTGNQTINGTKIFCENSSNGQQHLYVKNNHMKLGVSPDSEKWSGLVVLDKNNHWLNYIRWMYNKDNISASYWRCRNYDGSKTKDLYMRWSGDTYTSNIVDTETNQAIAGYKTFTRGEIQGSTATDSTTGKFRASTWSKDGLYSDVWLTRDESGTSNGTACAGFRIQTSNGKRELNIMKASGTEDVFAYCPTPNNNSNTNTIPTTAWVRNHTSLPSQKYIDLSIESSGTHFTAPANGYYVYTRRSTTTSQYLQLINNTSKFSSLDYSSQNVQWLTAVVPALLGQTISCYYDANGTISVCRFIYAEIDSY